MIESDPVLSWLLRGVLGREGFDVTIETSGQRAIAAADEGPFDVVVVDRETAGIDGFDVVTYVRHRFPDTPILLLTAMGGALVAKTARERGATRWVEKPIRVEELVRAIVHLVDGAPAVPARAGDTGHLWGLILAGGQGVRLRPLVRHIHGEPRPKQYARIVGARSLLRHTLDRVALAVPERRTVIVSVHAHARYLEEEAAVGPLPDVLMQPHDRGTAAGILFPALWIHRRDPDATIAIFPSDHFVGAVRPFVDHVREVATFVEGHPERIVLVGATPTEPETEYGWIEAGGMAATTAKVVVRDVRRFVEKPSAARARECFEAGALWNTFVLVARAATLVDAARQLVPDVHDALAAAVPLVGTSLERATLRRAYAAVPSRNFSSEILAQCTPLLGVSTLEDTDWCDWGSPRRVVRTLRRMRMTPDWLRTTTAGARASAG